MNQDEKNIETDRLWKKYCLYKNPQIISIIFYCEREKSLVQNVLIVIFLIKGKMRNKNSRETGTSIHFSNSILEVVFKKSRKK